MSLIYINGKFEKKEAAKVSVLDHGFLYGDSVFETMRAYNGTVRFLTAHLERIIKSLDEVSIKIPLTKNALASLIYKSLELNNISDAYIRLAISRGCGEPGLDFDLCGEPTVMIYVKHVNVYPDKYYEEGIAISLKSTDRLLGNIKSGNFLVNKLFLNEAKKVGALEVVFINSKGFLTEGSFSNVFIVKNGSIYTPSLTSEVLPGITRNKIFEVAVNLNLKVSEHYLTREDLVTSDECFVTNTIMEIMPVKEVLGVCKFSNCPGDITLSLIREFKNVIKKECGIKN